MNSESDNGINAIKFEIGPTILYLATFSKVESMPNIVESTHCKNAKETSINDAINPFFKYSSVLLIFIWNLDSIEYISFLFRYVVIKETKM